MSSSNTSLSDEWGFFTGIPDEFISNATNLSDQARWLFVLLRFHTNKKTKTAFPSYQQIKDETKWASNTIAKAVRELESAGWLTRKKQFGCPVKYVLVRPQSLPLATTDEPDSPCRSQLQSLPLATTVLAARKDINRKKELPKKEERERAIFSPASPSVAEVWQDVFGAQLGIHQQTVFESEGVTDLTTFRRVLGVWKTNGYSKRGIDKIIDRYKNEVGKNGHRSSVWEFLNVPIAGFTNAAEKTNSPLTDTNQPNRPAVETGRRNEDIRGLAGHTQPNPSKPVATGFRGGACHPSLLGAWLDYTGRTDENLGKDEAGNGLELSH